MTRHAFSYAIVRIVPHPEYEEFLNAGVILHCPEQQFLAAHVKTTRQRLSALWPTLDCELIEEHLRSFVRITEGHPEAGPIARLNRSERFHWLTSPRSTVVQVSPVHSGLCEDSQAAFEQLVRSWMLTS